MSCIKVDPHGANQVLYVPIEGDGDRSELGVTISDANQSTVVNLYDKMDLIFCEGDPLPQADNHFQPFEWNGRVEADGLADARKHVEDELRKLNVPLDREGYKVVDVHRMEDLLDVSDEKIGDIRGGTDLIIVPTPLAWLSYHTGISVLFEIKSNAAMLEHGLDHYTYQCLLKVLCARVVSDQPGVLLVLTDLTTKAMLYEIDYDVVDKKFLVRSTAATLGQMATKVSNFLFTTEIPYEAFRRIKEKNDPREFQVLEFKRTKMSPNTCPPLEHFFKMREGTEPDSRERALLAVDMLKAMGVTTMPTILQFALNNLDT